MPKLKVTFNPLWSLSDMEQADLEQKRAQTQLTRAQTAQTYIDKQVIDPSEVRKKLADSEEFDVENMLDEYDEDLFGDLDVPPGTLPQELGHGKAPGMAGLPAGSVPQNGETPEVGHLPQEGDFAEYAQGVSVEEHAGDPEDDVGNGPAAAPAATKLPQDMSEEELEDAEKAKATQRPVKAPQGDASDEPYPTPADGVNHASVGVLVISDGKILTGTRHNDTGYGLICGPGGHIEDGETPEQAAYRETEEEFGISPKELVSLGFGPVEPETGLSPHIFLCTEYEGQPDLKERSDEAGDYGVYVDRDRAH